MDKLSFMFDAKQFAAEFRAARDNPRAAPSEPGVMMWLEGGVGSAGAGFAWGHGQMNFQGREHLFRVSSLSMADVGAAGIYATGRITRLSKISDFSGNYRVSSSGATTASTGLATYLANERGVVIELRIDVAQVWSMRTNGPLIVRSSVSRPKPVVSSSRSCRTDLTSIHGAPYTAVSQRHFSTAAWGWPFNRPLKKVSAARRSNSKFRSFGPSLRRRARSRRRAKC